MRLTTFLGACAGILVMAAGCSVQFGSDTDENGAGGSGGTSSGERVSIDGAIAPNDAPLPPFEAGGPARQVASIEGPNGNVFSLIENELMVAAASKADVDGLVARYNGEILATYDFASDGDTSGLTFYAVRIDSKLADSAVLEDSLAEQDGGGPNGIKVSSAAALGTMAAFAAELKRGISVFPNFVMRPDAIADRDSAESTTAVEHAGDYSQNAFEWPYMKRGGPMDIGVAEAWRVLEAHDKLDTRVPVLIMDAGFRNTPDMPADTVLVGASNWDQPNTSQCCNGTCDCRWHGTGSARAAGAMANDSFGGVGSGGPVVKPLLLQSPVANFFDYLRYIIDVAAGAAGANIINISASTTIDQWVCDLSGLGLGPAGACSLPHRLGEALRAANRLLIASAGNDGSRNLDSGDFTIPCEMNGTVCVGGLAWNSAMRDTGSSYATRGSAGAIDLYAPFEVWVGPDPETPTVDQATIFSGTSASAPFVAGIAALVKAANPSLSASGIAGVLQTTAHTAGPPRVHRWVNAYAAVKQAVGGAVPPFVQIVTPTDGSTGPRLYVPTKFKATLESELPGATVTWNSSLDGPLGTGLNPTFVGPMSFGTHTITATATVSGVSHTDSVEMTLTNTAPVASILTPGVGSSFYTGQLVSLLGSSVDQNENGQTLTNAQVSWFVDGTLLGSGHARDIAPGSLSLGSHTLKFVANDGSLTSEATRTIQILPNPVNLPPNITSLTPPTGTDLGYADVNLGGSWVKQVVLKAVATDPDGPTLPNSAYSWSTTYTHMGTTTTTPLGTGSTITANLAGVCNTVQHTVTVTVTDSGNAKASKSAVYTVHLFC